MVLEYHPSQSYMVLAFDYTVITLCSYKGCRLYISCANIITYFYGLFAPECCTKQFVYVPMTADWKYLTRSIVKLGQFDL